MDESKKPTFSGRIELGHILQMIVIVCTIIGGLVGTYIAFQGQVNSLQWQTAELAKRLQQTQDDQKIFNHDISQTLAKITEQLTDLRILVAGSKDSRHDK